jgi:hypothetical protein
MLNVRYSVRDFMVPSRKGSVTNPRSRYSSTADLKKLQQPLDGIRRDGTVLLTGRRDRMTEADWSACTDPEKMLEFLRRSGKLTPRKGRLFKVALCYRIWHLIIDERSRKAVEIAEKFAEGDASLNELESAYDHAFEVAHALEESKNPTWFAFKSAAWAADLTSHPQWVGGGVALEAAKAMGRENEQACQVELFRCICGNPFRHVSVDRDWLNWHDGAIPNLAHAIYDERAFDRLPILGDALEDSGCHDADILGHCRQPGPHVRGCWVIDLLTGRG